MEYQYLSVFHEEDALKAFAFSTNSPLRVVWRRLCGDPKRMRKYIEDLENYVLKPYRIRKERLGSPFWSMQVLRDSRFVEDSGKFKDWAKEEPWCEDDAERYVYLTSKLFYVSESAEEFIILTRPVPEHPPQKEKDRAQALGDSDKRKEAFKQDRPKSFMAGADAQEAMKNFQKRKSQSFAARASSGPPQKVPAKEATKNSVETLHEEDEEEKAEEPNRASATATVQLQGESQNIADGGKTLAESTNTVGESSSPKQTDKQDLVASPVETKSPQTEATTKSAGNIAKELEVSAEQQAKTAPQLPPAKPSKRGSGELPLAAVEQAIVTNGEKKAEEAQATEETATANSSVDLKPNLPANKPRKSKKKKGKADQTVQEDGDDIL
jgi:hypothetical protein